MSLRNEICKETCIVVDRSSKFLETSGSKLDIEQNSKSRGSLSFLSDLYKTTWTCIVEGVVEYCRIVYDIFPPSFKVCNLITTLMWKFGSVSYSFMLNLAHNIVHQKNLLQ